MLPRAPKGRVTGIDTKGLGLPATEQHQGEHQKLSEEQSEHDTGACEPVCFAHLLPTSVAAPRLPYSARKKESTPYGVH